MGTGGLGRIYIMGSGGEGGMGAGFLSADHDWGMVRRSHPKGYQQPKVTGSRSWEISSCTGLDSLVI